MSDDQDKPTQIVTNLHCESFMGPRGHPMPCFKCDVDIQLEEPHRHFMRVHVNGYQPFSLHQTCLDELTAIARQQNDPQ